MKLPDFTKSSDLNRLKRNMGMADDVFGDLSFLMDESSVSLEEERALESDDGWTIKISDVDVLEDGTLAYKNRRIILYLRDRPEMNGHYQDPRFHLANCSTLRKMKESNRFSNYVSYSKDEGLFLLNLISGRRHRTIHKHLDVCQNCLDFLRYDDFSLSDEEGVRKKIVKDFIIKDYYNCYSKTFHPDLPRFCFETAPLNTYSRDFERISRNIREARGWKCEAASCRITFSKNIDRSLRRFLHVHHINGQKNDDTAVNLRVLCLYCHAQQPMHSHLKRTREYEQFETIRRKHLDHQDY